MTSNFMQVWRSIFKAPGYSGAVVMIMAVGIGASTAGYTVARSLLTPPMPLHAPGQLVVFKQIYRPTGQESDSIYVHSLRAYLEHARSFAGFAPYRHEPVNVVVNEQPHSIKASVVTPSFFSALGVLPGQGRTFRSEEFESEDGLGVAVLSHAAWVRWFGAAPDAVGREVLIKERKFRIVGVLGRDWAAFAGTEFGEIFLSERVSADMSRLERYKVVARLMDGVTIAQAQVELAAIKPHEASPKLADAVKSNETRLSPLYAAAKIELPRALRIFVGAAAALYLLACVNAGNIMATRNMARRTELAVRVVLGGRMRDVIGLLLVESLTLMCVAAGFGVLIARWMLPVLSAMLPAHLAPSGMDGRAAIFGMGLGILAGFGLSLWSAVNVAKGNLRDALQSGVAGASHMTGQRQGLLVLTQIVLATTLLVCASLLLDSVRRMQRRDVGLDPRGKYAVTVVQLVPPRPQSTQLSDSERLEQARQNIERDKLVQQQIERELASLPGVTAVARSAFQPFRTGFPLPMRITVPARPELGEIEAKTELVSPEYMSTIGLRIVEGNGLQEARPGELVGVVVNETLVRKYFGDTSPVGIEIGVALARPGAKPRMVRVLGVAKDVLPGSLRNKVEPVFYMTPSFIVYPLNTYVLRLEGDTGAGFEDMLRKRIHRIDPWVSLTIEPLGSHWKQEFERELSTARIMAVMAGVALLLASFGLYSMIAYMVALRRKELGLRLALGADPSEILQMVLRRGLRLAAVGLALGLACSYAASMMIASLLYETRPFEPAVYAAIAGVLFVSAIAACWFPARRAMRLNPATLLRAE